MKDVSIMTLRGEKSVDPVRPTTGVSSTSIQEVQSLTRDGLKGLTYEQVIDDICDLDWVSLTQEDLISVAWVYYYFSTQFRESLEIARNLYPDDDRLHQLDRGERATDNLSPWPGVAAIGEKMNHDEFMKKDPCTHENFAKAAA
jgi:hypothetical protein